MSRYHPLLVSLHWLLAVLIILGLILGSNVLAETPNSDPAKLFALMIHMSMGILILVLMIIRLVVRALTKKPPEADIGNALANQGAKLAHWGFYIVVLAMCASGLAISIATGLPDIVFGGSGEPLPDNFDDLPQRTAHGVLATVLGLLILAHVLAGLFHQFIRKDKLFSRMWFGSRKED